MTNNHASDRDWIGLSSVLRPTNTV